MGKGSAPAPAPESQEKKPVSAPVNAPPKDATAQKRGVPLAQRPPNPAASPLLEEEQQRKGGLLG